MTSTIESGPGLSSGARSGRHVEVVTILVSARRAWHTLGRMIRLDCRCLVASVFAAALGSAPAHAQERTWLFESVPSRPLALSSDGARLYAVNTPDAHLEIFDVRGGTPVPVGSVPVGLDPVAVALRNDGEAWVVNHLSDSVSVVDVAADPPRVIRTILVGDEPSDVVFAGPGRARAFITVARRGQNTADPQGSFDTPGIGRAEVWVLDAGESGLDLFPRPIAVLDLFTDRPRALAVSGDGSTVYAAGFLTGNRTTALNEGLVCDGSTGTSCSLPAGNPPGGLPAPLTNADGAPGPATGLIVRFDGASARWLDELGRNWSSFVRFSLPDLDVFAIDAAAATPSVTRQIAGVGTVLYAMAVNPRTGRLYVANTEARNEVRFEGPGTFVTENGIKPAGEPASVRGHLHEARVTIVNGATATPRHLNSHLDYGASPQPASARQRSLAQPMGMEVSGDGDLLYLAAFGSGVLAVLPIDRLEAGTYVPSADDHIALSAGGPTGVVLDEGRDRVFVATRFDDGVSVVRLSTRTETAHVAMHTPEPAGVYWGRPIFYDARAASSTGEASCASCHVLGDMDGLAWDLGNPDGAVARNTNPGGPIGGGQDFHPLKGPMTTQTLRGMSTHGPLHWRGDRSEGGVDALDEHAAFETFNPAFPGLLGRDEGEISAADMSLFADFALAITQPPNPIRRLDNVLRADEEAGQDLYFNRQGVDGITTCNGCHSLDPVDGFFGTGGLTTFEMESQEFKVPHLRNLYQKVGMFGMPPVPFFLNGDNGATGAQVRGFGFLHDGSTDTVFRFVHAQVFFGLQSDGERRQIESFLMAFDSDLAPVVGQSVTVAPGSDFAVLERVDLLAARAGTPFLLLRQPDATECDLVAHAIVGGEARGFLRQADGRFLSDRAAEAARTLADLISLGTTGQPVTFLCAAPGSGRQRALDRDGDGALDRDEIDRGESPVDRPIPSRPGGPIETPDAGPGGPDASASSDAGPGSPDAGATVDPPPPDSSGGDGGCASCSAAPASNASSLVAPLLALVVLSVRRRRRAGHGAGQAGGSPAA
jgi:MYXO-CTERM domain-containing protein